MLHCNLATILDTRQILGMVSVPSLVMHEAVVIRAWSGCSAVRLDHGNGNTTGVEIVIDGSLRRWISK
eukprot:632337-Lingulodinium_polyedra.AAC.1